MAAPPSQKYRSIGFDLTGGPDPDARLILPIRPESISRSEPSRLQVQQTLGGAWLDAFDRGVSVLTLAGTNGWRGGLVMSGEDYYQAMRATCYLGWHARRAALMQAGNDPSEVQLSYIDNLNSITAVCAPMEWRLDRSRSRPLLIRYTIRLLVLDDSDQPLGLVDSIINAISNPLRWLAGITGLGNVLGQIDFYASAAQNALGAIAGAVGNFLNMGTSLFQSVMTTAQELEGTFDATTGPLLTAGMQVAQAGSNGFAALAGDPTLPPDLMLPVMSLAGLYNDALCTMANSFTIGRGYTDFDALLGASACSSTGGGDPPSSFVLQQLNPFDLLLPATDPGVSVTPDASTALATLQGDPLSLVGQQAAIGDLMATAARGVVVA